MWVYVVLYVLIRPTSLNIDFEDLFTSFAVSSKGLATLELFELFDKIKLNIQLFKNFFDFTAGFISPI